MPVWAQVALALLPLFTMIFGGLLWIVSRLATLEGSVKVLIAFVAPSAHATQAHPKGP